MEVEWREQEGFKFGIKDLKYNESGWEYSKDNNDLNVHCASGDELCIDC